jgi:DNA-binding transcriptional ArsR family regulator
MSRKVNKYFVTIPVSNKQIAKLLGSETNWKILEALREAGMDGLSAEEISEKIKVPKSSVYSILSKLAAADWVESTMRRPSWGRPSKEIDQRFGGKPTRVFIQNVPWGNSEFDPEFIDSLDPLLENIGKNVDDLRGKWLSVLEKIVSAYQTDELKKFLPQDAVHEECGYSHEGLEFLSAISLELLAEILYGKDFDDLARKHKFKK